MVAVCVRAATFAISCGLEILRTTTDLTHTFNTFAGWYIMLLGAFLVVIAVFCGLLAVAVVRLW